MATSVTTYAADLLVEAGGIPGLLTPRLDLITAISTGPSKNSKWADLTIATYTGYPGPITPTVSAAYISGESGQVSVDLSDAVFNGPSSGAGVNVIGWVFHDTTGTPVVYAVGLFDGQLALQSALDRVTLDVTIGLGTASPFSVEN